MYYYVTSVHGCHNQMDTCTFVSMISLCSSQALQAEGLDVIATVAFVDRDQGGLQRSKHLNKKEVYWSVLNRKCHG